MELSKYETAAKPVKCSPAGKVVSVTERKNIVHALTVREILFQTCSTTKTEGAQISAPLTISIFIRLTFFFPFELWCRKSII